MNELKSRVEAALTAHVGPALDMDGTQLEVLDVTDGVARIRLGGVCGNCPSSIMLVVNGIEEELRKHVPEVACIEAVP
jgi:Fe-S cluster biogenesis protein NfuA